MHNPHFGISITVSFDEIDPFPQQPDNNNSIRTMPKLLGKTQKYL